MNLISLIALDAILAAAVTYGTVTLLSLGIASGRRPALAEVRDLDGRDRRRLAA